MLAYGQWDARDYHVEGQVWETVKSGLSGEIQFEDDNSERLSRRGGLYRFVVHLGKGDFDKNGKFGNEDIDSLTTAIREDERKWLYPGFAT